MVFPVVVVPRRVRDEGHRPIPEREVLPLDRVAGWELRNRELVPHDLILKSGILPREDLVEGSQGLQSCARRGGLRPYGRRCRFPRRARSRSRSHDQPGDRRASRPCGALGARLPGPHDRYPRSLPQDAGIAGGVEGLWSVLLLHLVQRAEKVLGRYALIAHSLNYRPFPPILAEQKLRGQAPRTPPVRADNPVMHPQPAARTRQALGPLPVPFPLLSLRR